jgi:hypothetical protein
LKSALAKKVEIVYGNSTFSNSIKKNYAARSLTYLNHIGKKVSMTSQESKTMPCTLKKCTKYPEQYVFFKTKIEFLNSIPNFQKNSTAKAFCKIFNV